jgi:hypothetical protein
VLKGGEVYPGMEMDQQFPRARVVRFEETRYTQVNNKTGFAYSFFSDILKNMVAVM